MIKVYGIIGEQYTAVQFLSDLVRETEPVIDIDINSPGGFVVDGFQMYRALTDLKAQGRRIRTHCHGECASIATILFVAGDDRIAGCPLMIHNPWTICEGDASTLEQMAKDVKAIEKEMESIYMERCKLSAEQLSDLMDYESVISQAQAVALGLATQAENEAVALLILDNSNTNKNKNQMAKEDEKKLSPWQRAMKALGRDKVKGLSLDTQEGTPLVLEKEEGEPQVDDKVVSPTDGVLTLSDGRVVTVVDGVITNIADPSASGEDTGDAVEPATIEEAIDVLEEVLVQLEDAQSKAKTPEEEQILNAVKMAGGITALLKKANVKSTYQPAARTNEAGSGKQDKTKGVVASSSKALDDKLAAAREAAKAKVSAKK